MLKSLMKIAGVAMLAIFCTVAMSSVSLAQSNGIEGKYKVTATSSELGTLNFGMVLKRSGDKWSGEVVDSPTPLTVTAVTVDAENKVTITADAGGTTVTIAGKYDGGKIAGDFSAGDIKGTWSGMKDGAAAAPAAAATATSSSAGGAASALEGTYDFKIVADGQGEFPMTLVIKRDGGKLVTEVPSAGDLNVVGIEVKEGDVVNLTATYQGNGPIPLNGKRTGDEIGGKWEFGGFSGTWTGKKKK
ncbi:MAG: hypothetical protein IPO77_17625 [Acidobacteria bacterium]|nr:hypothetical protein [Acidobacteriota bacterium]